MKARYPISLALTEEDKDALDRLTKKGITTIQVFRKGLEGCGKKIDMTKQSK